MGKHHGDLCSVIMCTYKQPQYLPLALNGVFSQTYPNIEFIVVSVEGDVETDRVLEGYANRVKWVKSDKANLTYQRNLGLWEAIGEWIQFLDSDDFALPFKTSMALDAIDLTDALVVYSGYLRCNLKLHPIEVYIPPYPFSYLRLLGSCYIGDYSFHSKKLHDEFGPLREEVHPAAMYDFWLKTAEKYPDRIVCNAAPTFLYRSLGPKMYDLKLEMIKKVTAESMVRSGAKLGVTK